MQSFYVPEEVGQYYGQKVAQGVALEAQWEASFAQYRVAYPELASELTRQIKGELPVGWKDKLPIYTHTVRFISIFLICPIKCKFTIIFFCDCRRRKLLQLAVVPRRF